MIRRICHAHLAALAIAAVSLAASAAYVTPWYVNPVLKDRFWLGVDSFTPTGLAIGADATRLAISAKPEGASDIIRVYDLGDLVYTANVVQTNRHVTAYTASTGGLNGSPRLAAHANDLIGVDAAGGTAAKFTFESRKWVGRYAPEARTFAAATDATSFALDSANALWSNATDAGREGLLVKRTLSGTAYAEADTVATGLAAVDAVAVYTVNGTEYREEAKELRKFGSTEMADTIKEAVTEFTKGAEKIYFPQNDRPLRMTQTGPIGNRIRLMWRRLRRDVLMWKEGANSGARTRTAREVVLRMEDTLEHGDPGILDAPEFERDLLNIFPKN